MSDRLMRFLIDLSKDPYAMEAFSRDPELLLSRADLSAEEKAAVRSGDPESLARQLGLEPELLYRCDSLEVPSMPPPPDPSPKPEPGPRPDPNPGPPKPPNPSPRASASAV